MKIVRLAAASLAVLTSGIFLSGCGSKPPSYTKSSVCGVPTSVVRGVMGTSRFTVGQSVERSLSDVPAGPRAGALPLSKGKGGITRIQCDVKERGHESSISFAFSLQTAEEAGIMMKAIMASDPHFETGGGVGTTNLYSGNHENWRWACSTTTPRVGTPVAGGSFGPPGVTERERKALVAAVAKAAGCPAPGLGTSQG